MDANRRTFLLAGTAAAALGAYALFRPMGVTPAAAAEGDFPYKLTDAEWKAKLSPEAYDVLRNEGTEMPGSSPLLEEHRAGTFACAGCDQKLFDASTKFESGTGWPSFYDHLPGGIATTTDSTLGMTRTEVHCANCGGHLGHVFDDGPQPTGLRYCMDGVALKFIAA